MKAILILVLSLCHCYTALADAQPNVSQMMFELNARNQEWESRLHYILESDLQLSEGQIVSWKRLRYEYSGRFDYVSRELANHENVEKNVSYMKMLNELYRSESKLIIGDEREEKLNKMHQDFIWQNLPDNRLIQN